ncbi:MAG: peroxide stress protein YaaA [Myxococcota bacterium]|nr:peroxide stress protein YaaA [Myxococcota bacterium]MEC9390251.1 peroxide stress protein YaaA [Myxococcota bacterium]
MLAVLSPAKKLDTAPHGRGVSPTQPALLGDAVTLADTAKRLATGDLQALMGISENLATLNRDRFQQFSTPFTDTNAKPAVLTFNGDTYTGFDAASLSDADLQWSQDRVAILSGLYGLLRPLDLIQPYRLEMGTRLANPKGANLYEFWGGRITEQLAQRVRDHADSSLINLASNEYFKSVHTAALPGAVITPAFKEIREGQPKMISFMAKRARGMMARFIVEERLDRPEGLKDFSLGGYAYDPALSTDTTWTFTR